MRSHTEYADGPTGACVRGTVTEAVHRAQELGRRMHIYRVTDGRRTFRGYAHPDGRVTTPWGETGETRV